MIDTYRLDGHKPVLCRNDEERAAAFSENRRVAYTEVGDLRVSTVFLAIDHQHGGGSPLLFETMIFGNDHRGELEYQDRCSTWEEAEAQHKEAVAYANRQNGQ